MGRGGQVPGMSECLLVAPCLCNKLQTQGWVDHVASQVSSMEVRQRLQLMGLWVLAGWGGGGCRGLLIVCVLLWMFEFEPPLGWRRRP